MNHFQSFNLKLDRAHIGKIIKAKNSLVRKASLKNLDIPIHHEPGFISMDMVLGSKLASNRAVYFIANRSKTKKPPIANERSFLFQDIGDAIIKMQGLLLSGL